ncbi:MAG: asparaginase [Peptostreptococcaceae bacterium]|nr:asparaginase [Peptostreptococcaceae bacterium]
MKKVLLLTTGGTIASINGDRGLQPEMDSAMLLDYASELRKYYDIDTKDLLNLDSSNIQAEEWQTIAQAVYKNLDKYDGIVITHGTDTMAYTASMLSYMLYNLNKPVVLTGSQLPIDHLLTDAKNNLYTAFSAVEANIMGVSVAFNHKIINGCRAVKVRTLGFEAFESVNAEYLGETTAMGLRVNHDNADRERSGKVELYDKVSTKVFLLKLVPGTDPQILEMLKGLGYRGVVVETFGLGGMHFIRRNLLEGIKELVSEGISVVACSQCLYETSDFSIYEVGKKLLDCGIITARDMTSEAAVTKLMWALGQTDDLLEIKNIFNTNFAGEVTILEV